MAILACLLWSSAFAGIKIGLLTTTPLHFAGVRFMLAGFLALPFCGNLGTALAQIRNHLVTVLIISFFPPAECMTVRKAISLIFGVLGVLVIAANRGEIAIEGPLALLGIGLLLLSNLSGAISNLLVARKTINIQPLVLNSVQLIIGGGFLLRRCPSGFSC